MNSPFGLVTHALPSFPPFGGLSDRSALPCQRIAVVFRLLGGPSLKPDAAPASLIPTACDDSDRTSVLTICFETTFTRSEEHTSELQSQSNLVCRLLLEKKNKFTGLFQYSR